MFWDYFVRKILWRIIATVICIPLFGGTGGILSPFMLFAILPIGFIWAGPMAEGLGHLSTRIFIPSDDCFEIRPQFSIAESLIKKGCYGEAIEAYHGYAVQYPKEITPHLRIADLQLDHFGNAEEAIQELKAAIPKAPGPTAISFIHHRLADLHLQHRKDRGAALEFLREIQRRCPNTKQAKAAMERAERILKEENP